MYDHYVCLKKLYTDKQTNKIQEKNPKQTKNTDETQNNPTRSAIWCNFLGLLRSCHRVGLTGAVNAGNPILERPLVFCSLTSVCIIYFFYLLIVSSRVMKISSNIFLWMPVLLCAASSVTFPASCLLLSQCAALHWLPFFFSWNDPNSTSKRISPLF